ncbi:MAG: hypothetical protein E7527_04030 [Ruminococcaceae bacterium]|nr:hypothetical protein [Oscillospiraceae bacterium]
MDTFFEQIIKKNKGAREWAIIVGTVVAGLILAAVSIIFSGYIGGMVILALAGIAWLAWWLITSQNIEYEYCVYEDGVTNSGIDVDQITAQRKRRRLVSVSGRKVEALQPYDPATPVGKFQRHVMVAPDLKAEGLWYFTYNSKKNGHTFVVFQPNDRVLRAFYRGLPKLVQMDTERAAKELGIDLKARPAEEE